MYLKSLSLYGFKTFAVKTDFLFKPGCTAFVGSNGSGKSNLIDAMIWAMGEQSVKSIRGRKMEEVVFHGSENKKPLGYAQVMVTFDNEDGFFPLPHSEISIMRRYYKSGDSEFAINREPCRLRDIQNLMRDTGLGMMNYSVISQGDVEYIIDLSPHQRREIFDEAAGINKYRIEKQKTLKKVSDTESNMARINDIVAEIEEALEPLRIQADKAKRYEELTEEIERLKLNVMISDVVRLKERITQLDGEMEEGRKKIAEDEELILKNKSRSAELESKTDSERNRIDALMEDLAGIGNEVGRAEESIRGLTRSKENYTRQIDSLKSKKTQSAGRVAELEGLIADCEKQLADRRAELDESEKQKADFMAAADGVDLASREDQLRRECSELRPVVEKARAGQMKLESEKEILHKQKVSHDREYAGRRASQAKLSSNVSDLKNQLDELRRQEKERSERLADLEQKNKEALDAINTLSTRRDDIKKEYEEHNDNLRELRASEKSLRKLASAVQSLYAQADTADTAQVESILDGIEAPEELQKALRRALGDAARANVASVGEISKTIGGAGQALIYLVREWFERTNPPDLSALAERPGVAGRLSDMARAGEDAGPVARRLLDSVLVTETGEAAAALAGELPPGAAAVSSDGEYLFTGGLFYAGRELVTPEAVSERRKQTEADLETEQKATAGLREKLEAAGRELNDKRNLQANLEKEIRKLQSEADSTAGRSGSLTERIEFYEAELEEVNEALAQIAPLGEDIGQGIESVTKELEDIRGQRARREEELKKKEDELGRVAAERKEREQARLDMDHRGEELRKRISDLNNSMEYSRVEIKQINYRTKDIDRDIEDLQSRADRIEKDIEAAREELARWVGKRKSALDTLAERRQNLETAIAGFRKINSEIETKKKEVSDARENLLQTEVKKARAETQLSQVREQFHEEFPGLPEEKAIEQAEDVQPGEKGRYRSLRSERDSLMPVNLLAIGEFDEKKKRHDDLLLQLSDLEDTRATLLEAVERYDEKSRQEFLETFKNVQDKFLETFVEIFGGGDARLVLTGAEDPLEAGVDIAVQIPGKRMRNIRLLSGGEKALCALTLIFSILKVKPSPFYMLDEVDAGLDDVNVKRFVSMLQKYSREAQFFIITHNKGTLEGADHFYGITMQEDDGFSKVISVSLE